jgi:ribosomal protein L37E
MRNSTIITKKKPCKSCGRVDYHFSRGRCAQCAKVEDFAARLEKENEKVIEEEDLGDLIADADAIFSQFIRLKYADNTGHEHCFTCSVKKHWSMMQNGHFMKRAHLYLRWDERNCRPQCQQCNELYYGQMAEYSIRLDQECKGLPDILRAEATLVHKPTRDEIRQVIAEYSPRVTQMKAKL